MHQFYQLWKLNHFVMGFSSLVKGECEVDWCITLVAADLAMVNQSEASLHNLMFHHFCHFSMT